MPHRETGSRRSSRRLRLWLPATLVILLVLAAGYLVVRSHGHRERPAISKGIVVSDPADGFEMTVPSDWRDEGVVDERGQNQLFAIAKGEAAVQGSLLVNVGAPTTTLAKLEDTEVDHLKQLNEIVDSTATTKYGGEDAIRFEYTDTPSTDIRVAVGMETWFFHNGKQCRVSMTFAGRDADRALMHAVLRSIRLTG